MPRLPEPASLIETHGLVPETARRVLADAVGEADDGEIFFERSRSESFLFDDGRLKSAAFDTSDGFGLRVVAGESAGYAHSSEVSEAALKRAAGSAALARRGYSGVADAGPRPTNRQLYDPVDPTDSPDFETKVALLQEIDAWC
ncbi:MAG: PmbA/TldA family metallopeptidase, partial [Phenylobacterium sp.]